MSLILSLITVTWYILLLSSYCPSNLETWILSDLNKLINNVIEQLTQGLEKLMEETASVFWVDLGYRLRSRMRVPLQDFRKQFTSHTVYCYIVTVIHGATAWFSARSLGRGPGYARYPPKTWIMSPFVNFNNLGPRLTCVVGVIWNVFTACSNWCSLR